LLSGPLIEYEREVQAVGRLKKRPADRS